MFWKRRGMALGVLLAMWMSATASASGGAPPQPLHEAA